MIKLDYIEIDKSKIPATPQRGQQMTLERAVVLLMLDPGRPYLPIDVAKFFKSLALNEASAAADAHVLRNARRAYSDLAFRAGFGKNPTLKGAQWSELLQSGLGAVAYVMDDLKARMSAEPGVIFVLADGCIIRHPEQDVALDSRLEQARSGQLKAGVGVEETVVGRGRDLVLNAGPRLPGGARMAKMTGLLLMCILPFVIGSHSTDVDEVRLEMITEMGSPYNGAAYFVADGKRYDLGNNVHFEGELGVITKINREAVWINDHPYPAPPLIFFDNEMDVEGNFVVFPGSPRRIAGNFWLGNAEDLDAIPPGYISWLGSYWHVLQATLRGSLVMESWSKITGRKIICHGDNLMIVQPKYQLDEYLDRLGREGAKIIYQENQIEVFLP